MSTHNQPALPDLDAEFDVAIERAMKGIRDPDAMDQAAREMDQGREEIGQRLGDIQVAVELIRQVRDEA
jgi:hypothetical protein